MSEQRRGNALVWGIILIVIGAAFLAENFLDLNAWDYLWKLWPLILVVWGAQKLIAGLHRDKSEPEDPSAPPRD
jgi:hypothetical protein